jgi:hypothetical protein
MRKFFVLAFIFVIAGWQSASADVTTNREFVLGNDTSGPFTLAWQKILIGTETVSVDGSIEVPGIDYNIDINAGTLTFTHPLSSRYTATVTYEYDPKFSKSQKKLAVPLQLDLARSETSNVYVSALYQGANLSGNQAASNSLTLGLGAGLQVGKSQWNARMYAAPQSATTSPNHSSDQTAFDINGALDPAHGMHMSMDFGRTGLGFDNRSGAQLANAGTQHLGMSMQFAPSKKFAADLSYNQSESLKGSSANNSQLSASLSLTPSDRLHFQTKLAEYQSASGSATQDTTVILDNTPSNTSKLHADLAIHDTDGKINDKRTMNLAASVGITKSTFLSAAETQNQIGNTASSTRTILLAMNPSSRLKMNAGYNTQETVTQSVSVVSVDGSLHASRTLDLAAGYKSHSVTGTAVTMPSLETSTASISLVTGPHLKVTGSYGHNPENNGVPQPVERHGLGLETSSGGLSIAGGYDWSDYYVSNTAAQSMRLALGVKLDSCTQFTGGFQQSLSKVGVTPQGATSYTFGINHNGGGNMSLSLTGSMDQHIYPNLTQATEFKGTANIGMKF